jgi:hypothetical protein
MLHASNSGMLQSSTSAFKIGTVPNMKPSSGPLALVEKIRDPMPFVLQLDIKGLITDIVPVPTFSLRDHQLIQ